MAMGRSSQTPRGVAGTSWGVWWQKSLELFNESIDFSLEAAVPDPVPFDEKLRRMLDDHEKFILTTEQQEIGYEVRLNTM